MSSCIPNHGITTEPLVGNADSYLPSFNYDAKDNCQDHFIKQAKDKLKRIGLNRRRLMVNCVIYCGNLFIQS